MHYINIHHMQNACHMHITCTSHACHMYITCMPHSLSYFKPLTTLHTKVPSTELLCQRNVIAINQLVLPAMTAWYVEDTFTISTTKPEWDLKKEQCARVRRLPR